jgi:N6-adenosine-specific RNA methylase IME4
MAADLYRLLYADPAWRYDDASLHRGGAARHYETCSTLEIAAHLERFADPSGCSLACWQTWPMQEEQDAMLKACGWRRRTLLLLWVKTTKNGRTLHWGQGHYTRANTEPVFLWTRGAKWPRVVDHGVHQVMFEPVQEHSRKPAEARHRIERLFGPIPRIELYHRGTPLPGWDAWGDEVAQPTTET